MLDKIELCSGVAVMFLKSETEARSFFEGHSELMNSIIKHARAKLRGAARVIIVCMLCLEVEVMVEEYVRICQGDVLVKVHINISSADDDNGRQA